jgi:ATP-dependent helicase HepA
LLQVVYLLECVADRRLDIERFLATQPLLVTVDTRLVERAEFQPSAISLQRAAARNIDGARYRKVLARLVPPMLECAESLAGERATLVIEAAIAEATTTLDTELARLVALHAVNPSISAGEIDALTAERSEMLAALPAARLRLDAVRFVVSPDFLRLR